MLAEWNDADAALFSSADSLYFYHEQQIDDFLTAVANGTRPLIDGLDGRKPVELFTAIYRSTRSNAVVKLPL
jgi:predicted dehydrogenase